MYDKKRKGFMNKIVKTLSIVLVFGVISGGTFAGTQYVYNKHIDKSANGESTQQAETLSTSKEISNAKVSDVVDNVMPSVVAITNVSETSVDDIFSFGKSGQSESAGSGIIVKDDGKYLYIATNNHVVEGASKLTVQFVNDKTAEATIQGTDPSTDLAVVKIKLSKLSDKTKKAIKVATLGDSDELKVGENTIAIGNALGIGQSVTTGIISAVNREVTVQDDETKENYTNKLIQTDAAINPGNSGGALLNSKGEVIGINSSKYADSSVEGMGFAIPINTVKKSVGKMIEQGSSSTKNDSNSGKSNDNGLGRDGSDGNGSDRNGSSDDDSRNRWFGDSGNDSGREDGNSYGDSGSDSDEYSDPFSDFFD